MGRKKPNKTQTKARQRAQLIMKVRCGLMNACEAAKQMGVSRKTYYKWEQCRLAALLDGLCDQEPGRPEKPVNEAEQVLEQQLAELRRQNQAHMPKLLDDNFLQAED